MIPEKMLELVVLSIVQNNLRYNREAKTIEFNGKQYDDSKIRKRWTNLVEEFIEPYVIDSTSKE